MFILINIRGYRIGFGGCPSKRSLQVANNAGDTLSFRRDGFFMKQTRLEKSLRKKHFCRQEVVAAGDIGIRDDPANPVAPVVVGIRVGSPAEKGAN